MFRRLRPAFFLIGPAILAASVASGASAGATVWGPRPGGLPAASVSVPSTPPVARFAVSLPLRNQPQLDALLAQLQNPSSPNYHKWLTAAQFASRFGPSLATKLAIAKELRAAGFAVRIESQAVFAHGPEAAAERYFNTRFALRSPDGVSPMVFTPLAPLRRSALVTAAQGHIIGLDGLPQFHSNALFSSERTLLPQNAFSAVGPYFAPDLREAYAYPSYRVATGAGVTIGIISSSPTSPSDIAGYFNEIQPSNYKAPSVVDIPIDGGGTYDASGGATGEVTLDVEMSGGSAPGAGIFTFDIPDLTDGELLEAYSVAVSADVDIVSSSIGGCEKAYDNTEGLWVLEGLHNVFAEGSTEGVTFVGASGDNGAFECGTGTTTTQLGVQTPTDDPIMIGVGGSTTLTTTFAKNSNGSAYVSESSFYSDFTGHGGSIWGSDGGVSLIYARPSYQTGFTTFSGRGVPDLGMHMGGPATGNSGDYIDVGGQFEDVFGTSAAAPEFAGLLALRLQLANARQGDLHSALYTLAKTKGSFRNGIPGNNGYYGATTALWDPVMGLGSPYGRVIAGVPTAALASTPFTTSNP